jgi:hypothetical protein
MNDGKVRVRPKGRNRRDVADEAMAELAALKAAERHAFRLLMVAIEAAWKAHAEAVDAVWLATAARLGRRGRS